MTAASRSAILHAMQTPGYRITVRGRISERLLPTFEGMEARSRNGVTVLEGAVVDQTALYGLLERLRDFGMELVRVEESR